MAEDRIDPSEQVPEADLLDQQAPLDPRPVADPVSELPETPQDADEADPLEQCAPVLGDNEDDYRTNPLGWGGRDGRPARRGSAVRVYADLADHAAVVH